MFKFINELWKLLTPKNEVPEVVFTPSLPLTWWIDDMTHRVCGLVDDPKYGLQRIPWPDNEYVHIAIDKNAYDELKKENEELKIKLASYEKITSNSKETSSYGC